MVFSRIAALVASVAMLLAACSGGRPSLLPPEDTYHASPATECDLRENCTSPTPTSTLEPSPTVTATPTPSPAPSPTATATKPPPTPTPRPPTATPRPATATQASNPPTCHPSYPDVCIPPAPPDLDCPDIGYRNFRVIGADPHRFDRDRDGIGCES